MRCVAHVLIALAAAACAPAPADGRVAAPTAPDPPAPDLPQAPLQPCAKRVVHVFRREKTAAVARCQVAPIELASDLTAEIRRNSPGRLALAVITDHESADNLPPAPSLAGRSYDVDVAASGLDVRAAGAGAVDEDEARRVRALASAALRLPDADDASRERALERVLDLHLRGVPAQTVSTSVTPGSGAAFVVRLDASESDAGMCHRWSTAAHLTGDLTLRGDGTIERVGLHGPVTTTEALCPEGARQAGGTAEPRDCTRGDVTFTLETSCARP